VQFPDNPEFAVFLALTLHDQGRAAEALQLVLETLCATAEDPGLTAYQRAIRHAAAKLR
jgi:thioredoxin-like negative regulator of GroEL